MRRIILAVAVVSLTVAVACGSEPPADNESNDNQTTQDTDQNDNQSGNNQTDDNSSDNDPESNQNDSDPDSNDDENNQTDDDVSDEFVERAGDSIRNHYQSENVFIDYLCECDYEEEGYGSESDCLDDKKPTDQQIEDAATCFEDAVAEYGKPAPDGVVELYDCYESNVSSTEQCIDDAEAEYDQMCEDTAYTELLTCGQEFQDTGDTCETELEGEAQNWFTTVNDIAGQNDCLADLT